MVEVLVASTVLVVLMLPLFVILGQGVRTGEVSLEETQARLAAHELLDQLAVVAHPAGWPAMEPHPHPNDPPAFAAWATLPTTGVNLPGPAIAAVHEIPVNNFTVTGIPYPQERATPEWSSFQRVYLSPMGAHFTRRFKVHPGMLENGANRVDPDLAVITVDVGWTSRISGPQPERRVTLQALVANPALVGRGY